MSAMYVASPAYIEKHGSPQTPEEMMTHQALMQATRSGRQWMATSLSK